MQSFFESAKTPVVAVEFHYFRLERDKWTVMLTRLKQLGATALAVPLPWGFHAFEADRIDLTGATNPRRAVTDLLALSQALDLPCFLQLGPYLQAGLLRAGLPAWLNRAAEGSTPSLSPALENWFKHLSQSLVQEQWPAGPIIALELGLDPPPGDQPQLSLHLTEVRWPIWLRKRYEGIEALNQAYGTSYHNVSEVKFPQDEAAADTPLGQDARQFLAEFRQESQDSYRHLLAEAGWQVPIYPPLEDRTAEPDLYRHALSDPILSLPAKDLTLLTGPIQIDDDPPEVGQGLAWARGAPIRADGSLRRSFWTVRQQVWLIHLPQAELVDGLLTASFDGSGLMTAGHQAAIKLKLAQGVRPAVYRLALSGDLQPVDSLKPARGYLKGVYPAETEASQTDLVLFIAAEEFPLPAFLDGYLRSLLIGQLRSLQHAIRLATALDQALSPSPPGEETPAGSSPEASAALTYTLGEARRGLREADVALRKTMASIGALEAGFGTMLSQEQPASGQASAGPVPISPDVFEGEPRELLVAVGQRCGQVALTLEAGASELQADLAESAPLTVARYRQQYQAVVATAKEASQPLAESLTDLRLAIGSETLPLLAWRVHDQLQAIVKSLRWGILRG